MSRICAQYAVCMNDDDLNYLKEHAEKHAQQSSLQATVAYDGEDGLLHLMVIMRVGGGQPKSIRRSVKFQSRPQAEAFIDDIIRLAQRARADSPRLP
jgi:hypothetical protein